MKLRARLAVAVLVAAIPVVIGLGVLRARFEWDTAERGLADFARDKMFLGGREACENAPEFFPFPPPMRGPMQPFPRGTAGRMPRDPLALPPVGVRPQRDDGGITPEMRAELWAYGPDFVSRNREAPAFPAALREAMESGRDVHSTEWQRAQQEGIAVAVRMPWNEGPCAFVLVRRATVAPIGAVRDLVMGASALCIVLMGAVWLAAGPIVERVRRLTAQVRDIAATHYTAKADVGGADEVAELAQAFNSAAQEVRSNLDGLEARERALRHFVENTTHDVMLPLTVLQGHLTALRRRVETSDSADKRVVLDALQEAHYMASLVHNLSAAARLESDALALERGEVDLVALVERVVARHAPIARAREISLDHAVPPTPLATVGDLTLLEQAVSNLIHNAVRYVHPGGHVAVVLAQAQDRFSLRVLDDGPGIDDALRAKVFERTFRSDDARSRHPDGLGLGLAIAKNVCDRHGFQLELRRPEAGGSEFEITGPSAPNV